MAHGNPAVPAQQHVHVIT
ncbi:unnamed protein product, partial [Rotaria sp. Silwood2]